MESSGQCIGKTTHSRDGVEFAVVPDREAQDSCIRHRYLWPVELPEQVREVRTVAWCVGAFCHVCMVLTLLAVPRSELRRWVENPLRGAPCLAMFACLGASAWWLTVTCANNPGYLAPDESRAQMPDEDHGEAEVVTTDGEIQVPLHWCRTCCILQPRRTKHCKECGFCVRTFDHHCFWIGGCVGERNHRHFLVMLTVWTALLLWQWYLIRTCLNRKPVNPLTWISRNWWVIVNIATNLVHLILIGGLWIYHLFLVATGQTTWEHLCRENIDYLQPFPQAVHPFSFGVRQNFVRFFSRSRKTPPQEWSFNWRRGQPIPFRFLENKYWSFM